MTIDDKCKEDIPEHRVRILLWADPDDYQSKEAYELLKDLRKYPGVEFHSVPAEGTPSITINTGELEGFENIKRFVEHYKKRHEPK